MTIFTMQVPFRVLWSYIKSLGFTTTMVVLIAYVAQLASDLGGNIWLSKWSQDIKRLGPNGTDEGLLKLRLGVYGGIGAAQSMFNYII